MLATKLFDRGICGCGCEFLSQRRRSASAKSSPPGTLSKGPTTEHTAEGTVIKLNCSHAAFRASAAGRAGAPAGAGDAATPTQAASQPNTPAVPGEKPFMEFNSQQAGTEAASAGNTGASCRQRIATGLSDQGRRPADDCD